MTSISSTAINNNQHDASGDPGESFESNKITGVVNQTLSVKPQPQHMDNRREIQAEKAENCSGFFKLIVEMIMVVVFFFLFVFSMGTIKGSGTVPPPRTSGSSRPGPLMFFNC